MTAFFTIAYAVDLEFLRVFAKAGGREALGLLECCTLFVSRASVREVRQDTGDTGDTSSAVVFSCLRSTSPRSSPQQGAREWGPALGGIKECQINGLISLDIFQPVF